MNRTKINKFWNNFYKNFIYRKESNFANFVSKKYLKNKKNLLEIGCGNGRDSFFFSKKLNVVAIDKSHEAIKQNLEILLNHEKRSINFKKLDAVSKKIFLLGKFDYVYARFFLHTINSASEKKILNNINKLLKKGGLMFLEFRTINDPLYKKGKKISKYERITDHYRRFIDSKKFISQKIIKQNFTINYFLEKKGLAKYKNENPSICRLVLKK